MATERTKLTKTKIDSAKPIKGKTVEQVEAALARLRSAKLLTGFRGRPAADVRALAELVVRADVHALVEPARREGLRAAVSGSDRSSLDRLPRPPGGISRTRSNRRWSAPATSRLSRVLQTSSRSAEP